MGTACAELPLGRWNRRATSKEVFQGHLAQLWVDVMDMGLSENIWK